MHEKYEAIKSLWPRFRFMSIPQTTDSKFALFKYLLIWYFIIIFLDSSWITKVIANIIMVGKKPPRWPHCFNSAKLHPSSGPGHLPTQTHSTFLTLSTSKGTLFLLGMILSPLNTDLAKILLGRKGWVRHAHWKITISSEWIGTYRFSLFKH